MREKFEEAKKLNIMSCIECGSCSYTLDKGNNLAHHLIQSFEPGEVSFEKTHEIGKQLADAVTKGQYEYVLTTHIDKGHVHNHIIFCAVNFVDYHKYNSNKRSYYGIRNISDRLCYENGLSVITPEKGRKGKSHIEYQAEKKLSDMAVLIKNISTYQKTKDIHRGYIKAKDKEAYTH